MKIKRLIQTIAALFLLIVFLLFTDPNNIPLALILVPYVLAGLIIYRIIHAVLEALLGSSINSSKLSLYTLITTVLTINFALLKSTGQLTIQDGLISAAIMIVSVIYVSRFSFGD